jgi:hypothetical protein
MFVWLWIVGVIALYFSWRGKRKLQTDGVVTGARAVVATQLTEILSIYVASGALFLLVSFWVSSIDASDPSLRALWECQNTLRWLAAAAAKLKLPGSIATLTMVAIALGTWRHHSELTLLLYGWLSRYQRAMKYVVLVASAVRVNKNETRGVKV